MGCRVVVLSPSARKRDEALALGAHEFVAVADAARAEAPTPPINRLLVTAAAQPDWTGVLPLLAPRASVWPLSVSEGKPAFPYMELLEAGLCIQGSLVATRAVHREMLDFAALHGVRPVVETLPLTAEGAAAALERLEQGRVTYRAVLVAE